MPKRKRKEPQYNLFNKWEIYNKEKYPYLDHIDNKSIEYNLARYLYRHLSEGSEITKLELHDGPDDVVDIWGTQKFICIGLVTREEFEEFKKDAKRKTKENSYRL